MLNETYRFLHRQDTLGRLTYIHILYRVVKELLQDVKQVKDQLLLTNQCDMPHHGERDANK